MSCRILQKCKKYMEVPLYVYIYIHTTPINSPLQSISCMFGATVLTPNRFLCFQTMQMQEYAAPPKRVLAGKGKVLRKISPDPKSIISLELGKYDAYQKSHYIKHQKFASHVPAQLLMDGKPTVPGKFESQHGATLRLGHLVTGLTGMFFFLNPGSCQEMRWKNCKVDC